MNTSCTAQPTHNTDSIPNSLFLRVSRICRELRDFDRHVYMLCENCLFRSYPLQLLQQEAAINARCMDRTELFNIGLNDTSTLKDDAKDKVFLITTFHTTNHQLRNIIYHRWDLLSRSTTTQFLYEFLYCIYNNYH